MVLVPTVRVVPIRSQKAVLTQSHLTILIPDVLARKEQQTSETHWPELLPAQRLANDLTKAKKYRKCRLEMGEGVAIARLEEISIITDKRILTKRTKGETSRSNRSFGGANFSASEGCAGYVGNEPGTFKENENSDFDEPMAMVMSMSIMPEFTTMSP